MLIIIYNHEWPIDTKISRALWACSVTGFILTQLVIIGRFGRPDISLIPDMIVGMNMVIFNIVTGTLAVNEAKPLYDASTVVGAKKLWPAKQYMAIAVTILYHTVYICLFKS